MDQRPLLISRIAFFQRPAWPAPPSVSHVERAPRPRRPWSFTAPALSKSHRRKPISLDRPLVHARADKTENEGRCPVKLLNHTEEQPAELDMQIGWRRMPCKTGGIYGQCPERRAPMRSFSIFLAVGLAFASASAAARSINWQSVDTTLGRKAAVVGDVHRYGFPRSDLHVTLDGVTIEPGLALGGWVAFKPEQDGAMIMGDLVLLESEINPVISKLIEGGLEITAIHNHLLRAHPATFYLHVAGRGDPNHIAAALRTALEASKTPLTAPSPGAAKAIDLNTTQLDQIVGTKGKAAGGIYQFAIRRRTPITEKGMKLSPPAPLGVATGINFQATGNGKAAITGDFVLSPKEVNPVVRALRASGIEVTAIHTHMLDEQPRLFFLHFWANDDAVKLAHGLRAALDKTASVTGGAEK